MTNIGQCSLLPDPDWWLSTKEIASRDVHRNQRTRELSFSPETTALSAVPLDPFQHLKARDVCRILNISLRTLAEWQRKGIMPHIKIGRAVRYRVADLKTALERYRIA